MLLNTTNDEELKMCDCSLVHNTQLSAPCFSRPIFWNL